MTPRRSLRAQARRIYRDRTQAGNASTATPDPSSQGGGEKSASQGGGQQSGAAEATDLTARVRALYEDSAVPVREIAAVAGVTERTIYKYAAKHKWKPRYRWAPDRGWRAEAAFAPVKGAGARFVRRADKGKPFARGLKATDPAAAARAAAQCREVARAARLAQAKAEARLRSEQCIGAIDATNRAARALNDFLAARKAQGARPPTRVDDLLARTLIRALEVRLGRWELLQAEAARAERDGMSGGSATPSPFQGEVAE